MSDAFTFEAVEMPDDPVLEGCRRQIGKPVKWSNMAAMGGDGEAVLVDAVRERSRIRLTLSNGMTPLITFDDDPLHVMFPPWREYDWDDDDA